jgi:hypothetical protein
VIALLELNSILDVVPDRQVRQAAQLVPVGRQAGGTDDVEVGERSHTGQWRQVDPAVKSLHLWILASMRHLLGAPMGVDSEGDACQLRQPL